MFDVVEAAVRSGHLDDARRHVDACEAAGLAAISLRVQFLCRAATALVADDDSYVDGAALALDDPGAKSAPFHVARVELAVGERLRCDRQTRLARPHLERAADRFDALHAAPWAARAAAALRATGRVRAASSTGAIVLTAQEREVAELAASGLTNREIGARLHLSPRTVGAHLYRIFPKLGITSRAALRDALSRLGDRCSDCSDAGVAARSRGTAARSQCGCRVMGAKFMIRVWDSLRVLTQVIGPLGSEVDDRRQ